MSGIESLFRGDHRVDNGLYQLRKKDLKELLRSKQIPFEDCRDKEHLIQRAFENNLKADDVPTSSEFKSETQISGGGSQKTGSDESRGENLRNHDLARLKKKELKILLDANKISHGDCQNKEDFIKRAIQHGLKSHDFGRGQGQSAQRTGQAPSETQRSTGDKVDAGQSRDKSVERHEKFGDIDQRERAGKPQENAGELRGLSEKSGDEVRQPRDQTTSKQSDDTIPLDTKPDSRRMRSG